jgi:uncharacterized protein YgiM (DUF1202 family)
MSKIRGGKMKRTSAVVVMISILLAAAAVTACMPANAAPIAGQVVIPVTGQVEATPDPCAQENIKVEIKKVSILMRDFDDVSYLAQSTPQNQTAVVILELQRLRRSALDYEAPACLKVLQEHQIKYMTSVVGTLMSFMSGGKAEDINQQLNATRGTRINYDAELARLMGVEYHTPTPFPTLAPTIAPQPTLSPLAVTTEQDINVFQGPGVNYQVAGNFLRGQNAMAYTRTADNEWVQVVLVDNPELQGWVAVRLVKLQGDISTLPVAKPQ